MFIRHEERLRRSGRHYESWKQRVTDEAGILQEIEWDNGVRSFYFHDPAGNVLEIADGDLWPEH